MFASPLIAQSLGARTSFEFGRIQTETDWILPIAVLVGLIVFVGLMYRRDTVELSRAATWWLTGLRAAALVVLFVVYLQPQWRTERDEVHDSRVVLLVDTSLSMETEDNDASPSEPSRAQQIVSALTDGGLLDTLRRRHVVDVWRFDRELSHIATLSKLPPLDADGQPTVEKQVRVEPIDWPAQLAAQGSETRLGEALRALVNDQRDEPLSGIVVFTDGQQNAGVEPAVAVRLAAETERPLYTVGIGSDRQPANVRISDFVAPARAYPGDKYAVTGYLQAQGMAGRNVTVELLSRAGTDGDDSTLRPEGSQSIMLAGDGEATPVRFELTPDDVGRRTLVLRVKVPSDDRNRDDNQREASVEIVDRKTRVLLFAGAASREYQFLRNQLRRDPEMTLDVLLQTGSDGVSQDASEILEEFPKTREGLFAYDCIVAFDPDWRLLSAAQVDLVEDWVGSQAGGLILIAGPVNTDSFTQAQPLAKIRALYPVEFNRRFALLDDGRYGSDRPWPLQFTREGLESEFLQLADQQTASVAAWDEFDGVYGFFDVRGPKPAATVYARYSDPRAAVGGEAPVYMAGQFYGSGRVIYLGSGELWRLRATSEAYFETIYTKLIRYVSQGRLLRGSNRGVLMTERDHYLPGSSVQLRAQLSDAQLEPLMATEVPVEVFAPDGAVFTTRLTPDATRPGSFAGQFTVRREGSYRLELPLPGAGEERLQAGPIQVTIPNLERENTRRNDALLTEIARDAGGQYYVGLSAALHGEGDAQPLAVQLRDATRTITISAAPQRLWDNSWFLGTFCGLLCVEWLSRRLLRLA